MSCIDDERLATRVTASSRLPAGLAAALCFLLGACSSVQQGAPARPQVSTPTPPPQPSPPKAQDSLPAAKPAAEGLPPPRPVKTHAELRRQAAERLVAANPKQTYMGAVPAILLAIPVLEVELRHDGSVKRINVIRKPGQAPETVQMAIDAIHRAAPFGNVSRMPEPWKFSETFLFNDQRYFKPRTLDE